jgi:hypothetical protein
MITFFLDLKTASVPQRASFGRCLTSPSGKTPDIFRHRNLAPKLEHKFSVFLKAPFPWGEWGKTLGNCAGCPAPASIPMDFPQGHKNFFIHFPRRLVRALRSSGGEGPTRNRKQSPDLV